MTRIALAEDNQTLAEAIAENIRMNPALDLLFVASNGDELIRQLSAQQPQVILMDINMPGMNGIEATKQIRVLYPHIKIIMLTVFDDSENIFQSILAGATGYLLKDARATKLFDAIEEALEGGAPMSPVIAQKSLRLIRGEKNMPLQKNTDYGLSKREIEILELLAQGLDYNKIAEKLFISPKTVRKHIENIYGKLQAHNKVEAITIARNNNLI